MDILKFINDYDFYWTSIAAHSLTDAWPDLLLARAANTLSEAAWFIDKCKVFQTSLEQNLDC